MAMANRRSVLRRQNDVLNPVRVLLNAGVNTGNISAPASYSETDDSDLIPLTAFLTNERSTTVTLKVNVVTSLVTSCEICIAYVTSVAAFSPGADGCGRQNISRTELGLQGAVARIMSPQWNLDLF